MAAGVERVFMVLKDRFHRLTVRGLGLDVKAVYQEYPIEDEDGDVVGTGWYGLSSGTGHLPHRPQGPEKPAFAGKESNMTHQ